MVLSRATYLVSVGNNINSRWSPVASPTISRALLPMTSKVDKLPEPVARDNNTIFTLKLGDQTVVPPYLTDNHSNNDIHIYQFTYELDLHTPIHPPLNGI